VLPPGHLDGEVLKVEERLDCEHDLGVLLWHAPQELLYRAGLGEVVVAVPRHLLHQIGEAEGKVLNLLTRVKGEPFPLLVEWL
jgi:hypothetical protein